MLGIMQYTSVGVSTVGITVFGVLSHRGAHLQLFASRVGSVSL